jgi:hypothetical protein
MSTTAKLVCQPRQLPEADRIAAAHKAVEVNPLNAPNVQHLAAFGFTPSPSQLALVTSKFWGAAGVHLTVGFLDNPPADLRARILQHMNAWSRTANVQFVETDTDPQVRIARLTEDANPGMGGYWSYVGTDILGQPANEPTLNLEAFTMDTPDSEFHRVVRHETGHTMGFPHEHMRRELVAKIDADKAIKFFGRTQGWDPQMVRAQVLTPIEDSAIIRTRKADQVSIMCYQLPGEIMKDGQPILGGTDIDPTDFAFAAKVYPKSAAAGAGGH